MFSSQWSCRCLLFSRCSSCLRLCSLMLLLGVLPASLWPRPLQEQLGGSIILGQRPSSTKMPFRPASISLVICGTLHPDACRCVCPPLLCGLFVRDFWHSVTISTCSGIASSSPERSPPLFGGPSSPLSWPLSFLLIIPFWPPSFVTGSLSSLDGSCSEGYQTFHVCRDGS
jgi:hypothetical protein